MNRFPQAPDPAALPVEYRVLAAIVENLRAAWIADGIAEADVNPQVQRIHEQAIALVADREADLAGRAVSALQFLDARGFPMDPMREALEEAFQQPMHRLALHGFLVAMAVTLEENGQRRNSGEAD